MRIAFPAKVFRSAAGEWARAAKQKGVCVMLINITGRQFEITEAIRIRTTEALSALDVPTLKVTSVNAVMAREKNRFQVSLVLNCKYHTLTAEVEDFDLYRALDAAVAKLDAQCVALKDRIQNHRGVPTADAAPAPESEA